MLNIKLTITIFSLFLGIISLTVKYLHENRTSLVFGLSKIGGYYAKSKIETVAEVDTDFTALNIAIVETMIFDSKSLPRWEGIHKFDLPLKIGFSRYAKLLNNNNWERIISHERTLFKFQRNRIKRLYIPFYIITDKIIINVFSKDIQLESEDTAFDLKSALIANLSKDPIETALNNLSVIFLPESKFTIKIESGLIQRSYPKNIEISILNIKNESIHVIELNTINSSIGMSGEDQVILEVMNPMWDNILGYSILELSIKQILLILLLFWVSIWFAQIKKVLIEPFIDKKIKKSILIIKNKFKNKDGV